MRGYRTFRTTMGHTVRVRMSDEEIAASWLYRFAVVTLPLLTSVLFIYIYVKVI